MKNGDPNQTSSFEVHAPGGWMAQFTSKRMAEWLSLLSLLIMASLVSVAYLQYREMQALNVAIKAGFAELRVGQAEAAEALRRLACLQAFSGADPQRAAQHCETVSKIK